MAEQIDHDQHYSAEGQRKLRLVECPDCFRKEQALSAALIDLENAETELKAKRRQIGKLKRDLAEQLREMPFDAEAEVIYEYWKLKCRPGARAFGDDRRSAVLRVLNLKDRKTKQPLYTPRYVCEAIVGASAAPNRNKLGVAYDDLTLICRDSSHLEDFHARYVAWKGTQ